MMPPLDSPCLMCRQKSSSSWKLLNALYNDFYYLDFPELMGALIRFSKDGWLLMSRAEGHLFFFNPFTKEKFELPSTTSCFLSVCFTSPPTSSDCFIFLIFCARNISKTESALNISKTEFGLIKFGDHKWETGWLDNGASKFQTSNCPPLFRSGVYYCLDYKSRNIRIFDPTREDESRWMHHSTCRETTVGEDRKEYEEEEEVIHASYMIEVEGDIWCVFVTNHRGRVSIEKLDLSEMHWEKLESLGDKCLYVSTTGSFAETCVDSDSANKIYFNMFYGKSGVVYFFEQQDVPLS